MRHLKKDEVKSVAQTEVNLCKAGLWGRVAMIMKAQNPFRNTRVSSFFLKFMQHIEIIDFFKTQHFI